MSETSSNGQENEGDKSSDEGCKHSCEKITEEEFEAQSRTYTSNEIRKLVNSRVYENLMQVKGKDPANWNWQVHDKQEGFFPANEEETKSGV